MTNIKNYINSSSLGVYSKFIVVIDGEKYLVKSGRRDTKDSSSILEPITECICYKLAQEMNIRCAEYYLKSENDMMVSYSKWFYNDETESFYSLNKLIRIFKIEKDNLYDNITERFPESKQDIDNMIVFDYIVNNTDRHLKNLGFLESENKLRFAPIYDNGLSLGSHLDDDEIEEEDIEELLLDSDYAKCFKTSNRSQLDLVDKHTLNLEFDYKRIVDEYREYLTEKRYKFILKLLEERIEVVKKCFQNQ